ncbi:MAG TPA: fluoride efflux transporter CrcB [Mycobacteriales bacterium]|nr:fluoride efflux transporter CrcB [Mycobacteriales bacterium]
MSLLLVLLGGALGAPARYLTDRALAARTRSAFPWGTLAVNVVGSGLLGLLAGLGGALPSAVGTLVGTGFCGALTTYSTFGYETVRLVEEGASWLAARNVLANVVLGLIVGVAAYVAGIALA